MNAPHRLHTWWQARDNRERWMLGMMFAMLAAFVYGYGLLTPLHQLHASARAGYDRAAADASVIHAQAGELRQLRGQHADSGLTAEVLLRSAATAGIPVSRQRRGKAGTLSIGIDAVQAGPLFTWLDGLRQQHHVGPSRLHIEKRDGALRAELAIAVADSGGTAP